MKRSRFIQVSTLVAPVALMLTACEEPVNGRIYDSVAQCEVHQTPAECRDGFDKAKQAHNGQAPQYSRKDECEEEFGAGQCESRGGSAHSPVMMGYLMHGGSSSRAAATPLYRPKGGGWHTPGGTNLGISAGPVRTYASATRAPSSAAVSRGGFGARAASVSSGG